MKTGALLLSALLALSAAAQTPPAPATPPVATGAVAGLKAPWNRMKETLVKAAEKMPEENYAFKPTPEVRSFGQLVGHVADANFFFSAMAAGEKPTSREIEKTKTSKADLIAALKESQTAADKVFTMTDAEAAVPTKLFGMDTSHLIYVIAIFGHNAEHYGDMVTYMRMKGLVPPSSEPRPTPPAPAK
jgi:uncharacterized damage-inducible protein DinB